MTELDEVTAAPAAEPSPAPADDAAPDTGRRRKRVRKWDRPPPPHDWRWWVGNVGRVMITVGLLMFGFVAYQLWGTGIETARAQRSLESDFAELLAAAPTIDPEQATVIVPPAPEVTGSVATPAVDEPPTVEPPTDEPPTVEPSTDEPPVDAGATVATAEAAPPSEVLPAAAQNIPELEGGDALARIEIPAIGVDDIVVAGIDIGDLKKGPGHFPQTPLPGQLGNAAIAGHRTTYGQPFFDVDKLVVGDEIVMTTLTGTYVYRVTGQQIVAPSAGEVIATTDPTKATLTLTSCHPKFTARQRIVIFSELDTAESAIVGEPVINYGRPLDDEPAPDALPAEGDTVSETATGTGTGDGTDDATDRPAADAAGATPVDESTVGIGALASAAATAGAADAFAEGWFSDPTANPHVLFWGLLLGLIGIAAYLLSRRFRHDWIGAMVGLVPFVVTLYFFFQNVNRLLPPNL